MANLIVYKKQRVYIFLVSFNMLLLYKKLVKRKKLVRFWLFFMGGVKKIFKMNFIYLDVIYGDNGIGSFSYINRAFKKVLSFFLSVQNRNSNYLFISSQLFIKSININDYVVVTKKIVGIWPGIFSNFFITNSYVFNKLDFKVNPTVIVSNDYRSHTCLVEETRLKKIPIIALVSSKINTSFIEYPIVVNSIHFFTMYFFTRIFFKIMLSSRR